MKRVYVGQVKLISFDGRYFKDCDTAVNAILNVEWAKGILAAPAVTFPNGKQSHEVANIELEKAEDTLIDYLRIVL